MDSLAQAAPTPAMPAVAHDDVRSAPVPFERDGTQHGASTPLGPVAYLVNQYPKVSHSFIRREIQALERQGVTVHRYAMRSDAESLTDQQDHAESKLTRYLLAGGVLPLCSALLRTLLGSPLALWRAARSALQLARGGDRPWPLYLVYLAQACLLRRWLADAGTGHLHAHFGTNSAAVAMLTRRLGGPPYSFTVHGPEEFDRPEALHLGLKVHHAAFVVAVSSYGRGQLCRWISAGDWNKVRVVRCGLDPDFYRLGAAPVPSLSRLVCVGRLCAQKGQLLLVEAINLLVREGVAVQMVLAGDGEMRAQIEARVRELQLQAQVRITGWLSSGQVRQEILASRALVLPSFAEGLPVVLMEAMALRRPVLTTYVAGIPELVRAGADGWLFPCGDLGALVAALRACLSATNESLTRMGVMARERVLARHDADLEAARLLASFRATAAAERGGAT